MLAFPPIVDIGENVSGYGRHVLPARPVGPTLSVVARVPVHICSIGMVRKGILSIRVSKRGVVVIRVREHHDVVSLAFAQQQMISGLRIISKKNAKRIDRTYPSPNTTL